MERLKVLTLLLGMVFVLSSCGKEEDNDSSDSLTDKLKAQGVTFQVQKVDNNSYNYMAASDTLTINCSDNSKSRDFRRLELLEEYRDSVQKKTTVKYSKRNYYSQDVVQALNYIMQGIQMQMMQSGFQNTSSSQCPAAVLVSFPLTRS